MKWLLYSCVVSLLSFAQPVYANNASGGNIEYEWISDSTYRIYFKYLRSCNGADIPGPNTLQLCIFNPCTNQSFTVPIVKTSGPITRNNLPNGYILPIACDPADSKCHSLANTAPGFREWWYITTVTLPLRCHRWRFSIIVDHRTNNDNLVNQSDFYVESNIYFPNISDPPKNSSPEFLMPAYIVTCQGQPSMYNNLAVDRDGDSLVYSIIPPKTSSTSGCIGDPLNATLVTQSPPLQFPSNPIRCNNTFSINSVTGTATFTPANTISYGASLLTFLVEEYRYGQLVGSVVRDVQIGSFPCTNPQPTFHPVPGTATGGSYTNNRLEGCIGQTMQMCYDIKSSDNGAKLVVSDNLAVSLPNAAITYHNQQSDSVRVCFTWTPSTGDAGLKKITLNVKDSTCSSTAYLLQRLIDFNVFAGPPVTVDNDMVVCVNEKVSLAATGGFGNYTWQILPGGTPGSLSCINCRTPIASPTSLTKYVATSAGSMCPGNPYYSDTVTLDVHNATPTTPTINITANPGTTLAIGQQVDFTANVSACNNRYYQWLKNGIEISGATSNAWSTMALKDNDVISCRLNCADTCPQPRVQVSNQLKMHIGTFVAAVPEQKVKMYPNPSDGNFIIETEEEYVSVELVNITGTVVHKQQLEGKKNNVNAAYIARGIYMVKLMSADKVQMFKLVVR